MKTSNQCPACLNPNGADDHRVDCKKICCQCADSISDELYNYDPEYPLCEQCGYLAYK